ncbi:MAG TPA: hypothetical protein VIF62_12665, partial [Labilithrix sp.]
LRCAPTCTATGVLSSRAVAVTGSDVYSATTDTIATCTDATCATAAHVADVLNLVMLAADGDDLYWTSDDVGNDGTLVTCKASACKGTMHAHAVHLGKAWGVAVDGANVYIGTNQAMGTVYAIPR